MLVDERREGLWEVRDSLQTVTPTWHPEGEGKEGVLGEKNVRLLHSCTKVLAGVRQSPIQEIDLHFNLCHAYPLVGSA
jgi:hypothetical protein